MSTRHITGPVYLESASVEVKDRLWLVLHGTLPTPCHQLQVDVQPPDDQGRIEVHLASLADPNVMCTEVLAPFTEQVPLDNLPPGDYEVWINGEPGPTFQVP